MIQLLLLVLDTIAIFALIHIGCNLMDLLSEYKNEQRKQDWRIFSLENNKYELEYRVNILEGQVSKNLDNDNACD